MIVLDTNIVSEAMRPRPNPSVITWLNRQAADTLYLSSVSLAELLFGIGALPEGKRRDRLNTALDQLLVLFSGRIIPFDADAARHYAQMAVAARNVGRPLAMADGYIAATAAARGFTVATRNTVDFETTGVSLINPGTDQQ
ncbi:type II toxin-antitoxin system VapC family toxin [Corynebacterium terpenotabidum]|uniref:Ribonuclease VapC n=1 Tax=Corynebacterium terpenotabidum Y-11 TaxID=1200352 RepID=S4XEP7_9CORY|nr:type II toxin-antitoxin system VapC family toxin [Corynebacterium terpenotabidum]AGP30080.1 PilT domain-containing protein [Corynebacterium terpenotabidum Y-11]